MGEPRIGALFAGYGGLDLATQTTYGGTMSWYSEIDRGALKILTHRFPTVPNIGDITAADWSRVPPVDILTGGSPCQDLSHAGKRAGMTEGTRSNLWVAMREAIAQLKPRLVIWENVRGAYSAPADSELETRPGLLDSVRRRDGEPVLRALGRVLGDLSDLGYDAQWHGLRAADVGAPHGRFRVFLVAHAQRGGRAGWAPDALRGSLGGTAVAGCSEAAGDARCLGGHEALEHDGRSATASNRRGVPDESDRDALRTGPNQRGSSGDLMLPAAVQQARWGDYAAAIARWETVLGRPAPAPTMTSAKGNPQLSPAFVEWMMGLPHGWVTDVPHITRNEALRALGNGVCPQQATAALTHMTGARA